MSLLRGALASSGGGVADIWSTGAFSFESPLKDLLDSGNYTLEQLLAEDELLQELRGLHPKLIRYLTTEQAVTQLVQYVVLGPPSAAEEDEEKCSTLSEEILLNGVHPLEHTSTTITTSNHSATKKATKKAHQPIDPNQWLLRMQQQHHQQTPNAVKKNKNSTLQQQDMLDDAELRYIRFPYMACEIICCEIPGILHLLVDGRIVSDKKNHDSNQKLSLTSPLPSLPPNNTIISHGAMDEVEVQTHTPFSSALMIEDGANDATTTTTTTATQQPSPRPPERILDLLFSVLVDTPVGQLDDYRAGYFEKILRVLFKKRPQEMMDYVNCGGCYGRPQLIRALLNHLYSHSIMQLAQRLLLPHRPVPTAATGKSNGEERNMNAKDEESGEGDENDNNATLVTEGEPDLENGEIKSNWCESGEAIDILLDALIGPDPLAPTTDDVPPLSEWEKERCLDLSLNASEVLISIIQNSMLSSKTMLLLTSAECLERLITAATVLRPQVDGDFFSPHESLLTSAMTVLESLILQLGGYGAVGTMSLLTPQQEEEEMALRAALAAGESSETAGYETNMPGKVRRDEEAATGDGQEGVEKGLLISDLTALLGHLPMLLDALSLLLQHPSTEEWKTPTQYSKDVPQPMLGSSRLRIVRVLESLVLLGDPDVDSKLVESDCLEVCLNLFWDFQWCSMLHQSVANLLVHVFEGRNARVDMQEYFLIRCNILVRLMDSFMEVDTSVCTTKVTDEAPEQSRRDEKDSPLPVSEDDVDAELEKQEERKAGEANSVDQVSTEAVGSTGGFVAPAQSFRFGYMGHVIIICQALVHACTRDLEEEDQGTEGGKESGEQSIASTEKEPLFLAEMVACHPLTDRWREFVATTLATETATQSTPLGGYAMSAQSNDPLHCHRPGLADDPDVMGMDSADPPMPPRGMLAGGDVIDMDDNDLDIAASMMAGLSVERPSVPEPDDDVRSGGGDSDRSVNSGETNDSGGYLFDDPLGKVNGGLGIELGKLTQYNPDLDNLEALRDDSNEDDDSDRSSSDEEPDRDGDEHDTDVPVMDLFAGNFNYGDDQEAASSDSPNAAAGEGLAAPDWSNFANFDEAPFDAGVVSADDDFGPFASAVAPEPLPDEDVPLVRPTVGIEDLLGTDDDTLSPKVDNDSQESVAPNASGPLEPEIDMNVGEKKQEDNDDDNNEDKGKQPFDDNDLPNDRGAALEQDPANDEENPYFMDEIVTAPSDELNADKTISADISALHETVSSEGGIPENGSAEATETR